MFSTDAFKSGRLLVPLKPAPGAAHIQADHLVLGLFTHAVHHSILYPISTAPQGVMDHRIERALFIVHRWCVVR